MMLLQTNLLCLSIKLPFSLLCYLLITKEFKASFFFKTLIQDFNLLNLSLFLLSCAFHFDSFILSSFLKLFSLFFCSSFLFQKLLFLPSEHAFFSSLYFLYFFLLFQPPCLRLSLPLLVLLFKPCTSLRVLSFHLGLSPINLSFLLLHYRLGLPVKLLLFSSLFFFSELCLYCTLLLLIPCLFCFLLVFSLLFRLLSALDLSLTFSNLSLLLFIFLFFLLGLLLFQEKFTLSGLLTFSFLLKLLLISFTNFLETMFMFKHLFYFSLL